MTDGDRWYDDEAGPMIRPFTLTRGRTRPGGGQRFDILARVEAVPEAEPTAPLDHARSALLDRIRLLARPLAELAADVDIPLGALQVLLGDLVSAGLIRVGPAPARSGPDDRLLRDVIKGLRRL